MDDMRAWLKKIRPKVIAVGKHVILHRQVGASGIHEVNAGQAVLLRNLLCTKMLANGQRVIGAAFDGCVVRDNQAVECH